VKTPEQLFDLYLKSVGRGANLLLNVPPDGRGLITQYDSAALAGFNLLRAKILSRNLFKNAATYHLFHGKLKKAHPLSDGNYKTVELITESVQESVGVELALKQQKKVNCIVLYEDISNGQHCSKFKLLLFNSKDELIKEIYGTTIGRKRIITFPAININTIELTIEQQNSSTGICEIEAFYMDEKLVEK
jgi:alpha-L-fucosidase